jgi:hypothetical protein
MSDVVKLQIKKRRNKMNKSLALSKTFEVRDLREKFFMVDDAYLNGWARIFGTTTSMVYILICRHVGSDQACFPTFPLMADKLSVSERQARRAVKILEFHNLIKVDRVSGQPNIYWLIDKKHWRKLVRVAKGTPETFEVH